MRNEADTKSIRWLHHRAIHECKLRSAAATVQGLLVMEAATHWKHSVGGSSVTEPITEGWFGFETHCSKAKTKDTCCLSDSALACFLRFFERSETTFQLNANDDGVHVILFTVYLWRNSVTASWIWSAVSPLTLGTHLTFAAKQNSRTLHLHCNSVQLLFWESTFNQRVLRDNLNWSTDQIITLMNDNFGD